MERAETSTRPRPVRRTQAERREVAERQLLAAALRLIAEKGVSRTTLAEVGEGAGYSRALPAVYFTDKSGLVRALWGHVSKQFQLKMLRSKKDRKEGLDAVVDFIEVYLTRTRGEIRRDVDPGSMAILILAALRGAISHWIIDPKTSLTALRKEYLAAVRRSLARA